MCYGDSLTLYINNHGSSVKLSSNGGYVFNDAGVGDEIIHVGDNLVDNVLADMLCQFYGFRVTVFLDTCHGGGFWGNSDLQEFPPNGFGAYDLSQLNNIALYSGAAEDKSEYAFGSSMSFWGKALLEAFKKPVSWSPDGLARFLEIRTLEIADDALIDGGQEPPVWYTLALGDLVPADMSLIKTFVASSFDFDMSAILLAGPDPISQLNNLAAVAKIGPGKSLFNKITDAQAYYEVGNILDACSTLKTFIKEVNAQTGKKVSVDNAEQFIAFAEFTIATIECPASPEFSCDKKTQNKSITHITRNSHIKVQNNCCTKLWED